MAIAFITKGSASGSTASIPTAAFTPTAVGQMILLVCTSKASQTSVTATDTNGNTYYPIASLSVSGGAIYVLLAFAGSASSTTTTAVFASAASNGVCAYVYSGAADIDAISFASGSSASPAGGAVAPAQGGEWIVTAAVATTGANALTLPTGYVSRASASSSTIMWADSNATVAQGSSNNPAWSVTSTTWIAVDIAIAAAAAFAQWSVEPQLGPKRTRPIPHPDVPYTGNTLGWAPTPYVPGWSPEPAPQPRRAASAQEVPHFGLRASAGTLDSWAAWSPDSAPQWRARPGPVDVPWFSGSAFVQTGWSPWTQDQEARAWRPKPLAQDPPWSAGSAFVQTGWSPWTQDQARPAWRGRALPQDSAFFGTRLGVLSAWLAWAAPAASQARSSRVLDQAYVGSPLVVLTPWVEWSASPAPRRAAQARGEDWWPPEALVVPPTVRAFVDLADNPRAGLRLRSYALEPPFALPHPIPPVPYLISPVSGQPMVGTQVAGVDWGQRALPTAPAGSQSVTTVPGGTTRVRG